MNKKLLTSLVFLVILLVLVVVIFGDSKSPKHQISDVATSTNTHELFGYYSTYEIGTSTCSAFVALTGDVDFIFKDTYLITPPIDSLNHPSLNIDLSGLTPEEKGQLLGSHDLETAVYVNVADTGERIYDPNKTYPKSCESFVKVRSVRLP